MFYPELIEWHSLASPDKNKNLPLSIFCYPIMNQLNQKLVNLQIIKCSLIAF